MILAIDQGTSGTTCLVFDPEAELIGRGHREFEQHFPRPGWVEHDAAEIWTVTQAVAGEALDDAGLGPGELEAVGITNQRETVVTWDPDTGEPLHRALVWQDRRTAERCDDLAARGGRGVFGTIDSWLSYKLCGEHVTDPSNASRTLLYDIVEQRWSPELCA